MPFSRFSRRSYGRRRPAARRAPARRSYARRAPTRTLVVRPRMQIAEKALNGGIQWKTTRITGSMGLNFESIPGSARAADNRFVSDIPLYLPTGNPGGDISQSRTSDRLFIKGISWRLGFETSLEATALVRYGFLRNDNLAESFAPATTAENWFVDDSNFDVPPSVEAADLTVQRRNPNLVRDKKSFFFDRIMTLAESGLTDARDLGRRVFYTPINQVAVFERSADLGEQYELKAGPYIFWAALASKNTTDPAGGVRLVYDADIVWAQA